MLDSCKLSFITLYLYFIKVFDRVMRKFLVFNRIPLAILLLALGFYIGFAVTWWIAWIFLLVGLLMIAAHYLIGPMSLIQKFVEECDMDGAKALLDKVKKPEWLYKPVRSSYYMLQANFSTMSDNLDQAETDLKKSINAGITEKGFEGTAYLQLGSIAYKKGNTKEAVEHLKRAVKLGLPDADNTATAYIQLASIAVQRREFKSAKMYYAKAKSSKPTNKQVVDQLNEMGKYMSRIPG